MQTRYLWATVAVLCLMGLSAAKQPQFSPAGWEYRLLKTSDKRWEQRLDSLGAAGWELVAYGPQRVVTDRLQYSIDNELYGVFVFKRPRQ